MFSLQRTFAFFIIVTNFVFYAEGFAFDHEVKSKLFIMLDVDNTITDRIDPDNISLKEKLIDNNYLVQNLSFEIHQDEYFFNYYKKRQLKYNNNIELRNGSLQVKETVVVRPTIEKMIKDIYEIASKKDIPVHVLICSRKDYTRSFELASNLKLIIRGIPFKDMVDVVPRENFRVELKIENQKRIGKSAILLREKYNGKFGNIREEDYVVLIDQLEDSQFIHKDPNYNLNGQIPAFEISKDIEQYDENSDAAELRKVLNKISILISGG